MKISKILIVDDEKIICDFISKKLNKLGYNSYICLNSVCVFDILETFIPDLIIMDIMMPVLNGIDISYRLKSNINTSQIPILIISAKTTDQDIKSAFKAGIYKYLFKPITLIDILTEIHILEKGI
jgi:two-component system alkaline phosphatase synthesis response regulator PhoP